MLLDSLLLLNAVQSNDIQRVKELVSNYQITPDNAYQSLIEAVDKELLEIVRLFVKAGLDVNFELLDGIPLERAVMTGNLPIVKVLLEGGADVNYPLKSDDNYTPLFSAACNGNIDMVKLLVEAGADVNCLWSGNYALQGAAEGGHEEVYNYLYSLTNPELREGTRERLLVGIRIKSREQLANPQINVLTDAVDNDNLCQVKEIIARGADINAPNTDGLTALITASAKSRLSILKELLVLGANPNIGDDDGKTPLMYAVGESNNRIHICINLIQAGANINVQDNYGRTALMEAANIGSPSCVQLLIEMNADINIKDCEGKSALDYALLHSQDNYFWAANVNYPAVVEILQQAGNI
ncbi:ankyrin repeat domain-containing protein [Nostoc sp. FACHB-87]|uniref:ankyrin repeat domain-containing protein n=1 Tax=Nostocales TaxID=1161 RepID=UPI001684F6AA|nr:MULTISPECIES: ankyrin repeat domain-containing protein [Nostocales]MBD2302569.1 ankyrin repeat domain-containing protein [Nostoc sp. FACHB-190]MBD2458522.1 ankyrin repeat domain-containing protein [Nostoc sp. FACHB-87]MBD2479602.1 ankyrin repeat domain-containing protein [Anabaena sp. FACHB-83]MBD2492232.1 ankyrin repeat domain-containing protein [Aulosira sp. FACHB-615]